ncbi:MAG TPA: 3'-5' exonuclease [Gemmatimonadaceae bacterium]|nr:3'-5' exonuclease [Gemmatimonadaceae bacterium]
MSVTVGGGTIGGIRARPVETLLTQRALTFLESGPADAVPLIEYVCQMPGAPARVAEQMAAALFAGHPRIGRDDSGRWLLTAELALDVHTLLEPLVIAPQEDPDSLSRLSYVVVDVETTGGRPWTGDRITEVAAIVVRDGQTVDRFETLVNPERPIPPMITRLTNISWEMVRHAPTFRDICDQVIAVLEGHVFVAHNAMFDWRFLSAEVTRASGRRLQGRRLCTVRLARRVLPQLRSRRLDSLAFHYGVEIRNRHRAGGDATATAQVFLRLLAEARSHACERWADLERLMASSIGRRRRRRKRSGLPTPIDKDTTA